MTTLTNAEQILHSLDADTEWYVYLILADAFADEGRWQEEEAVRWIRWQHRQPYHGDYGRWFWWEMLPRDAILPQEIPLDIYAKLTIRHPDQSCGMVLFCDSIRDLIQAYVQVRCQAGEG